MRYHYAMIFSSRQCDYTCKQQELMDNVPMMTRIVGGFLTAHDGAILAIHCHPAVERWKIRITRVGIFHGARLLELDASNAIITSTYNAIWGAYRVGGYHHWTD